MTKTGDEKKARQWAEWEATGDERVVENRTYRTNRTFIGLGTEDKTELEKLRSEGNNHIIFVDCTNFPDIKPVKDTQKIFEVIGHYSKEADGSYRIDTAVYGCYCTKCREFRGIENCLFKED
jgi:hypothetical protein